MKPHSFALLCVKDAIGQLKSSSRQLISDGKLYIYTIADHGHVSSISLPWSSFKFGFLSTQPSELIVEIAAMGLVHFEDGVVVYYPYVPSYGAGVAFVVLFTAATVVHIGMMGWLKTWYFIPMILGGICECTKTFTIRAHADFNHVTPTGEIFGHYGRAWAASLPNSPSPFMLQLMLILVAPVFLTATVYVTLGKLRQAMFGTPKRRCSSTVFFVMTDVVAFCTQIGGSLVQVTGNLKIMKIGDRVVLGGLSFQLVAMLIFLYLVFRFYQVAARRVLGERWRRQVVMLAVCVMCIWVRNLVRMIEFAQGFYGFISQNEAMLYIFDSFLMLAVLGIFAVLHPGLFVRKYVGVVKG